MMNEGQTIIVKREKSHLSWCVVQDTGVHVCFFGFKCPDISTYTQVTTVERTDFISSIFGYTLMLPFIKKDEENLQEYILV